MSAVLRIGEKPLVNYSHHEDNFSGEVIGIYPNSKPCGLFGLRSELAFCLCIKKFVVNASF